MPASSEIKQGFWITFGVFAALLAIGLIWMLFQRAA